MTAKDYILQKSDLGKLFGILAKEDLEKIEVVYYAPDISIIHKDSSSDYIYIIINGICGIYNRLLNGEEFCYYKISNLDVIGLSELLEKTQIGRYATIRSLTEVTAFKIKRSDVTEWMHKYPEFYNELIKGVINRLHNNLRKHVECKMYSAHANVVSYLIYSYELYKNNYEENYTGQVKINETREMISEFLGMSVRSTNSSVEKLKNLNLIHVKHGKIYLTNEQYVRMIEYKYELLL